MGHFEEQTPKLKRVSKYIITLFLVCSISIFFGRTISMVLLSFIVFPVRYVHAYYLPTKKGING
jgi:hypothetical protein